jgi:proline iminopeptidase
MERTWTTGTATGHPPVVLVHGGPGLWDYLEPVASLLDPVTVVHRYDQPWDGPHTIARYVADLEELRHHWGHERWIVAGHSFGATLAFAYAVQHPERTAALGYLSGVGAGDWRTEYRRAWRGRISAAQAGRLALLEGMTRTRDEEVEFRTLSWFTDHADPVQGWKWAASDAQHDAAINFEANAQLTAETSAWSDAQMLGWAGELTMPAWFVHGDRDPRPVSPVERLAAAVPHGQLIVISGAGHHPWRERPVSFGETLRRLVVGLVGENPH